MPNRRKRPSHGLEPEVAQRAMHRRVAGARSGILAAGQFFEQRCDQTPGGVLAALILVDENPADFVGKASRIQPDTSFLKCTLSVTRFRVLACSYPNHTVAHPEGCEGVSPAHARRQACLIDLVAFANQRTESVEFASGESTLTAHPYLGPCGPLVHVPVKLHREPGGRRSSVRDAADAQWGNPSESETAFGSPMQHSLIAR